MPELRDLSGHSIVNPSDLRIDERQFPFQKLPLDRIVRLNDGVRLQRTFRFQIAFETRKVIQTPSSFHALARHSQGVRVPRLLAPVVTRCD